MNARWFKIVVFGLLAAMVVAEASAQNKPKPSGTRNARTRPASGYSSAYGSGYTNPPAARDTTRKRNTATPTNTSGYSSGYGNTTGNNTTGNANTPQPINGNLPIEVVKGSGGGGLGDSVRPSLRTDNIIERQPIKDRTVLAYEHIREDDAVYKQRVWREIDTREKMNLPFRYAADEDNGNQRFISILFNTIQSGDVTAFSGEDDRFTTPLTKEQVAAAIMGGSNDTVPVTDLNGDIVKYEVRSKQIEPDSIYRFRIKEEWVFDKESSRMHVRILGIAPIMMKYTSSGVPIGDVTLFWAYYPDLRPTFAKYEVYNGKNYAGRMTWEDLFESRFFSSRITKSTMDNVFDQSLAAYVKDPLFRLWEGENIKEKIFNYEQDLWSY
jgi:gliding motility associated protien GldN